VILNNLITSLLVRDYDEAISFYSGKLGFVVVEDVRMGPDRWVTVALPNSHETVFALHVAKSDSDLALVGKARRQFSQLDNPVQNRPECPTTSKILPFLLVYADSGFRSEIPTSMIS
jgi:catechol 2,3-dioxygenase-like lactoylglutathione lyase family enzyme